MYICIHTYIYIYIYMSCAIIVIMLIIIIIMRVLVSSGWGRAQMLLASSCLKGHAAVAFLSRYRCIRVHPWVGVRPIVIQVTLSATPLPTIAEWSTELRKTDRMSAFIFGTCAQLLGFRIWCSDVSRRSSHHRTCSTVCLWTLGLRISEAGCMGGVRKKKEILEGRPKLREGILLMNYYALHGLHSLSAAIIRPIYEELIWECEG